MIAAAQDSELVEIIDHMLATARESVLSRPFHALTVPDMWRAAESAKGNAEAALAMLRMRGPAYFPWADAARDPDYAPLDGVGKTPAGGGTGGYFLERAAQRPDENDGLRRDAPGIPLSFWLRFCCGGF